MNELKNTANLETLKELVQQNISVCSNGLFAETH